MLHVGRQRKTSHLIIFATVKACWKMSDNVFQEPPELLVFVSAAPGCPSARRLTLLQIVTHVILTDIPLASVSAPLVLKHLQADSGIYGKVRLRNMNRLGVFPLRPGGV